MSTIILTGGGTAGHVMPNITLLPKLKTHFDRIVYIGSKNGIEKDLLMPYPFVEFYPITTVKLIRRLTLKNLAIPFKLLKGISEAKQIIKQTKPNIIFSKGGFVSLPVALAGHKQKIPILLYESDLSIGLSNKIAAKKAKCVLTTFPQTANLIKNGVHVGPPIQATNSQSPLLIKQELNIATKKPILLVIGGSLGSEFINALIINNIDILTKQFFIIHITGKQKTQTLTHKNYIQFAFYKDIKKLYTIADFAITRGGSNTIWELFSYAIPMLIIPLSKKISRGDQIQNALYFQKHNYAIALFEEYANPQTMLEKLNTLSKYKQKYKSAMQKNNKQNAIENIFNYICKFSKK